MASEINKSIEDHLSLIQSMKDDQDIMDKTSRAIDMLVACFASGNKVLLCGNGGSAADAEHIAAELSGKFNIDRAALFAEALHVNSAALTAISNDYGYENLFSRMLEAKGRKEDVLLAYSTSGSSDNVLKALATAKKLGVKVISFHGTASNDMEAFSDINFEIYSRDTARIQESYMLFSHIICEQVEKRIFG